MLSAVTPRYETVIDALIGIRTCTHLGVRFVERSSDASFHAYDEVIRRATRTAAALQHAGVEPGDRVAIVLPTSIHFLDSFFGTQLAGGIPAPMYPPLRLGKLDEYFARTTAMLNKIGARFLVTDARIKKNLGPALEGCRTLDRVIDVTTLSSDVSFRPVKVDPQSPAFLQFSSGTTRAPRAVIVSHSNLFHNLEMMDGLFEDFTDGDVEQGGVCWLPLYHDMGLVGFMFTGIHCPGTITYMPPELFVVRPRVWLQTISRYRATVSAAPNFAYGLCTSRIQDEEMEGVDLSNWKIALNGAEAIDAGIMEAFCERFARWGFRKEAMTPVYGLAEAGLGVTFSDKYRAPTVTELDRDGLAEDRVAVPGDGRRLCSVGPPLPGVDVEIRDDGGSAVEHSRVGRVVIRGPSVTRGYFNDTDLTRECLEDGWLDTGDLGFFHDGELHITGRSKELVILRGRNYAPQEIEELLSNLDGVRQGCVVALGREYPGEGEQLVVLAERDVRHDRSNEDIEKDIAERIVAGMGLAPREVRLLAAGTLPRTSSGKMRRVEILRRLQEETPAADFPPA